MGEFGIGQSVRRVEDKRFVTGSGRYVDDIQLPMQCHAHLVLSAHAHARIKRIDIAAASASEGVICVLTGKDVKADRLGPMLPNFMPEDIGGPKGWRTHRPILVYDRVRFVGDRVALVVAESATQARNAAELIEIEYEPLASVSTIDRATAEGAPNIWDECPGNVSFILSMGDEAKAAAVFKQAAHRVTLQVKNNRVAANPIEPRAAIGEYNAADDCYTLYSSTQSPHAVRQQLALNVFGLPESKFRIVSPDVGGGFGTKSDAYPEDALVLWASRRCGRPVRWVATRSDTLIGDNHARDEVVRAELALDANGKILAVRAHSLHALGAYVAPAGVPPILYTLRYTTGVYDIQTIWLTAKAVFTNTAPVHVYRGPGRAEGNYIIERLLDRAAAELNIAPDEIRRRNVIPASAMPYATPTGSVYDTGEFVRIMDECMELADWNGFENRLRASLEHGRLRGRSVIFYIEHAGIFNDRMEIRFDPGGTVTVVSGMHSHGQGHATTFAQLVSDWLGVPFNDIRFLQGDTDKVPFGRGTYAARSLLIGGSALRIASDAIIRKARMRAADLMQVPEEEVSFEAGQFSSRTTNRTLTISDVAKSLFQPVHLDQKYGLGLEAVGVYSGDVPNYPNGCHVCEVEIDPATGKVTVERYTVVDDVGVAINPMICEGQIHGGVAQGIGQAMLEEVVYDDQGQLLTGSLMDYGLPRADDLCDLATKLVCIPSTTNPLGVKGVGESGTIGAPPAIVNAVIDALRPLGVDHIDMPVTPRRVWHAIQEANMKESAT
ncbi:MAG: xanthine dehydrogenase family protein molybdopterin-binding subunit [Xanthobacteraceae bacterium]